MSLESPLSACLEIFYFFSTRRRTILTPGDLLNGRLTILKNMLAEGSPIRKKYGARGGQGLAAITSRAGMDSRPKAGKSEARPEPISSPGKSACRQILTPGAPRIDRWATLRNVLAEGSPLASIAKGGPVSGGNTRGVPQRALDGFGAAGESSVPENPPPRSPAIP
jgi:hypothetical protein